MIAQIIFPADGERADFAIEDCRLMSHVEVPLEIFLVEITFLA